MGVLVWGCFFLLGLVAIFFPTSKIRNVIWSCLIFGNEHKLVCEINEQLSVGSTNVNVSSFIAGCHECWICCIKIIWLTLLLLYLFSGNVTLVKQFCVDLWRLDDYFVINN